MSVIIEHVRQRRGRDARVYSTYDALVHTHFFKRRKKTEKEEHIEGEKRRPKTYMHAHSTSPTFRRDLPIIIIFILSFSDISEAVENKNKRFRSSNRKTLAKNGMIRKQKRSLAIIHRSHSYLNYPRFRLQCTVLFTRLLTPEYVKMNQSTTKTKISSNSSKKNYALRGLFSGSFEHGRSTRRELLARNRYLINFGYQLTL